MWDLPRPGLEPLSPALAGRFSTTAPLGKPLPRILNAQLRVMNTSVVSYLFALKACLQALCMYISWTLHNSKIKLVLRRREAGLNDLLLGQTLSVREVCERASWRVLRCWQGLMGFWDSQSTFQIRKHDLTEIFL